MLKNNKKRAILYVVSDIPQQHTISVFVEHLPDDLITVARFDWNPGGEASHPDQRPSPTYTIDISRTLSLELDRHWAIHPSLLSWQDIPEEVGNEASIEALFGSEMSAAMLQARRTGFHVLGLTLDKQSKSALAELQYRSPSTPPALRKLCRAMIDEFSKSNDTKGNNAIA